MRTALRPAALAPSSAASAAAIDWAVGQRPWVEAELAKLPVGNPFEPGEHIPLEGVEPLIVWNAALPRTVRLEHGALTSDGPREGVARRV